jgi:hypothetical protein
VAVAVVVLEEAEAMVVVADVAAEEDEEAVVVARVDTTVASPTEATARAPFNPCNRPQRHRSTTRR